MKQKGISTLVIAVIIVVVIAVIGVGVYLAMSGPAGNGGNGSNGGNGGNGDTSPDIAGASSLQYSVEVTDGGSSYVNNYMAKNIGTSNMMLRIEIESEGGDIIYILNSADQKAWSYMAGEWLDISSAFSDN